MGVTGEPDPGRDRSWRGTLLRWQTLTAALVLGAGAVAVGALAPAGAAGAPTVTGVVPLGPNVEGTVVTVSGTGFAPGATVDFGRVPSTSVVDTSAYQLSALVPPGVGQVDVTVTVAGATSSPSAADRFDYAPGVVDAWGLNASGQLGDGSTSPSDVPVGTWGVGGSGVLGGVGAVASGGSFSVALSSSGQVDAWGAGADGQLGDGSTNRSSTPVTVDGPGGNGLLNGIVAVATGTANGYALSGAGTVYAWGANANGQLGDGSTAPSDVPVAVVGAGGTGVLTGIVALAAGGSQALALSSTGAVYAWGAGADGQLGDGATADSGVPVPVAGVGGTGTLGGVVAVATGGDHDLALTATGTVDAWGNNDDGQLGVGTTASSDIPEPVVGVGGAATLRGVVALAAGGDHSLAVTSTGSVDAWGSDAHGQLGVGAGGSSTVPVPVRGVGGAGWLGGITEVAAGGAYSLAFNASGQAYAFGQGGAGQLGDGATTDSAVPVAVDAVGGAGDLGGLAGISAGAQTSLAVVRTVPTVTGLDPPGGPQAGGGIVTVLGTGFDGATAVDFGSVPGTSLAVVSPDQITVSPPPGSGTVDVTVGGPGGISATGPADQYSYLPVPVVRALSPAKAVAGTSVTVTGSGFSDVEKVQFGGTPANGFTVVSPTTLVATAPFGSGTVDVTVTTLGGTSATSASDQFTYLSAPVVTSVAPAAGPLAGGTTVTVAGSGLGGATKVLFGTAPGTSVHVISPSDLTVVAPAGTGTVNVTVTTAGGTSATSSVDQFSYLPRPTVSALAPAQGGVGTTVTVTGTGLAGVTKVLFGTAPATAVDVLSATQLTAVAPAGSGTLDVTVSSAGGTSATSGADRFTYLARPTVTALNPTQGPQAGGTTVTVTGTSFTGATKVAFGTTAATSLTVVSSTKLTVRAPAGTGLVNVTVTGPGGTSSTSSADRFTYVAPPVVTGLSPAKGSKGTQVTVTGTGFSGATTVDFGSTAGTSLTVSSATSLTVRAPAGSGTVDVTVTTPGGTSAATASDRFTY